MVEVGKSEFTPLELLSHFGIMCVFKIFEIKLKNEK